MIDKRVKKYLQVYKNKWSNITEKEFKEFLSNMRKFSNLSFNKYIINLNYKKEAYEKYSNYIP